MCAAFPACAAAQDWAKDSGALNAAVGAKRYDEALQLCARLEGIYRDAGQLSHIQLQRVNVLTALKRTDEAREACRSALSLPLTMQAKNELAWRAADMLFQQQKYAEAAVEFRQVFAGYGLATDWHCQDAARKVAECCAALKDYDAALRAAHVVYDAGEPAWAIPKIVECLRLLDGNADRAKAFVLYQMHGEQLDVKERPEPPRNVLAQIGYPAYDDEVQKSFEKSLAEIGNNWQDLRRKGRLCLYRGKPEEAARYLYCAFRECPNGEVARLGEELVGGAVRAVRGTEVGLGGCCEVLRSGTGKEKLEPRLQAAFGAAAPEAPPPLTPQAADVLAALDGYILEPLASGRDHGQQMRDRQALLDAYCRIAAAKGRADDVIRMYRRVLSDPRLLDLHAAAVEPASTAIRKRDGHLAGELAFLEELTDPQKTPAASQHARQMSRRELGELAKIRLWDKPFLGEPYRRFLPREEKKK